MKGNSEPSGLDVGGRVWLPIVIAQEALIKGNL